MLKCNSFKVYLNQIRSNSCTCIVVVASYSILLLSMHTPRHIPSNRQLSQILDAEITKQKAWCNCSTVDGSEIRRSPVDMINIALFTGFYTSLLCVGFLFPSTVSQGQLSQLGATFTQPNPCDPDQFEENTTKKK